MYLLAADLLGKVASVYFPCNVDIDINDNLSCEMASWGSSNLRVSPRMDILNPGILHTGKTLNIQTMDHNPSVVLHVYVRKGMPS